MTVSEQVSQRLGHAANLKKTSRVAGKDGSCDGGARASVARKVEDGEW
jgi:hypothetical protein